MLSRLFAPRRRRNQEEVAGRAAEVIVNVLFDVGVDRLLNGTVVLDKHFRLRFYSIAPPASCDALAAVAVRELAEVHALRAHVLDAGLDAATVARHTPVLSGALMRALLARSPELRALPARRLAHAASSVAI